MEDILIKAEDYKKPSNTLAKRIAALKIVTGYAERTLYAYIKGGDTDELILKKSRDPLAHASGLEKLKAEGKLGKHKRKGTRNESELDANI